MGNNCGLISPFFALLNFILCFRWCGYLLIALLYNGVYVAGLCVGRVSDVYGGTDAVSGEGH